MRGRYFVGIILILLGAGFLADQLGYVEFGQLLGTYWPLILILAGLLGLMESRSSKVGNLILLAFGIILQLNRLDMIGGDIFRYFFPAILIIIGLNIIFSKGTKVHSGKVDKENWNKKKLSEDFLDHMVLMSGYESVNTSQNFKGGRLTAIMGGIDIDLREANMIEDQAYIEVTAIMGGIDIITPKHWRVEVQGTPLLGGFSSKTMGTSYPEAPLLIIKGTAILGGVEIK